MIPPLEIRTRRLLMRCWQPDDAPQFKRSLDASLEQLRPWIPWAVHEPSPLSALRERLTGYRDDFLGGRNALYALMDPADREVMGGAGLYRTRVGPGAIEIGYWIRSDLAGRGLATEASVALTEVASTLAGIASIEIRCDPRNGASVAIPRKLGYRHRETLASQAPDGSPCDLMVWELQTDTTSVSR